MIQEDYCFYEVAKLLEEKGFDWDCISYYNPQGEIKYSFLGETNSTWEGGCISCPTHQMAMKWLREKHSIFIGIKYNNYYKQYKANITMMELSKSAILKKAEAMIKYSLDNDFFDTYEEAVETALKYCLTELI